MNLHTRLLRPEIPVRDLHCLGLTLLGAYPEPTVLSKAPAPDPPSFLQGHHMEVTAGDLYDMGLFQAVDGPYEVFGALFIGEGGVVA